MYEIHVYSFVDINRSGCVCLSRNSGPPKDPQKTSSKLGNSTGYLGRHTFQLAIQGLYEMSLWIHPTKKGPRKRIILSLGRGLIWPVPTKHVPFIANSGTPILFWDFILAVTQRPPGVFAFQGSCVCSNESSTSWTQSTNKTVIQLTLSVWGQKSPPSWPPENDLCIGFFTFSILKPSYSFKRLLWSTLHPWLQVILCDLNGSKPSRNHPVWKTSGRKKKKETSRRHSCDSLRNPHNSHFWTSSLSYLEITSTYMTNHPNEILNKHKPSPQSSRFPLQNPHTYMPQVLPAPPAASCLNDNSDTYIRGAEAMNRYHQSIMVIQNGHVSCA